MPQARPDRQTLNWPLLISLLFICVLLLIALELRSSWKKSSVEVPVIKTTQKISISDYRRSRNGYTELLKRYVSDAAQVNYSELQRNSESLRAFVAAMANLSESSYRQLNSGEKIAFWINSYNSLMLFLVVNSYPIKPSTARSIVFPKNSIQQIPNVWKEQFFTVMGRNISLDHIENEMLRKNFGEPRIHMAIVCASISCPPLRNEAYKGDILEQQLEDQSIKFLANENSFKIDKEGNIVYLSSIFKWFGADFLSKYSTENLFQGYTPVERALLNFISNHIGDKNKKYLLSGGYTIQYLPYDWSLNEQKTALR